MDGCTCFSARCRGSKQLRKVLEEQKRSSQSHSLTGSLILSWV